MAKFKGISLCLAKYPAQQNILSSTEASELIVLIFYDSNLIFKFFIFQSFLTFNILFSKNLIVMD